MELHRQMASFQKKQPNRNYQIFLCDILWKVYVLKSVHIFNIGQIRAASFVHFPSQGQGSTRHLDITLHMTQLEHFYIFFFRCWSSASWWGCGPTRSCWRARRTGYSTPTSSSTFFLPFSSCSSSRTSLGKSFGLEIFPLPCQRSSPLQIHSACAPTQ